MTGAQGSFNEGLAVHRQDKEINVFQAFTPTRCPYSTFGPSLHRLWHVRKMQPTTLPPVLGLKRLSVAAPWGQGQGPSSTGKGFLVFAGWAAMKSRRGLQELISGVCPILDTPAP